MRFSDLSVIRAILALFIYFILSAIFNRVLDPSLLTSFKGDNLPYLILLCWDMLFVEKISFVSSIYAVYYLIFENIHELKKSIKIYERLIVELTSKLVIGLTGIVIIGVGILCLSVKFTDVPGIDLIFIFFILFIILFVIILISIIIYILSKELFKKRKCSYYQRG